MGRGSSSIGGEAVICTSNIADHSDAFAPAPCIVRGPHDTHRGAGGQVWATVEGRTIVGVVEARPPVSLAELSEEANDPKTSLPSSSLHCGKWVTAAVDEWLNHHVRRAAAEDLPS